MARITFHQLQHPADFLVQTSKRANSSVILHCCKNWNFSERAVLGGRGWTATHVGHRILKSPLRHSFHDKYDHEVNGASQAAPKASPFMSSRHLGPQPTVPARGELRVTRGPEQRVQRQTRHCQYNSRKSRRWSSLVYSRICRRSLPTATS